MMKKSGFIAIALVVALGIVGVGYAAWSQTLNINGNVGMATMAGEFVLVTTSVTDPNGGPATCTVTRTATGDYYDTLNIEIANAYPGYNAVIQFDIQNVGTMPFVVNQGDPAITAPDGGAAGDIVVNRQVPSNRLNSGQFLSTVAGNTPEVSVYVPYENVPVQGGTYVITVPLTVHQFN